MSHLKPICKLYRRLILWATGAASTTKDENLLAESAMLSIDETLTIHTESTWTKWKCFHDRHPIPDLTLEKKKIQVPCLQQTIRLLSSSDTRVFRSESIALLEASAFAAKLLGSTIIFTHSKSNLEALETASMTNPEIAQLFIILQVNPKMAIQWIPGYSGIPGNGIVDLVAKWSAASPVLPIAIAVRTGTREEYV
jgi:hypothetical protein